MVGIEGTRSLIRISKNSRFFIHNLEQDQCDRINDRGGLHTSFLTPKPIFVFWVSYKDTSSMLVHVVRNCSLISCRELELLSSSDTYNLAESPGVVRRMLLRVSADAAPL